MTKPKNKWSITNVDVILINRRLKALENAMQDLLLNLAEDGFKRTRKYVKKK